MSQWSNITQQHYYSNQNQLKHNQVIKPVKHTANNPTIQNNHNKADKLPSKTQTTSKTLI